MRTAFIVVVDLDDASWGEFHSPESAKLVLEAILIGQIGHYYPKVYPGGDLGKCPNCNQDVPVGMMHRACLKDRETISYAIPPSILENLLPRVSDEAMEENQKAWDEYIANA